MNIPRKAGPKTNRRQNDKATNLPRAGIKLHINNTTNSLAILTINHFFIFQITKSHNQLPSSINTLYDASIKKEEKYTLHNLFTNNYYT